MHVYRHFAKAWIPGEKNPVAGGTATLIPYVAPYEISSHQESNPVTQRYGSHKKRAQASMKVDVLCLRC